MGFRPFTFALKLHSVAMVPMKKTYVELGQGNFFKGSVSEHVRLWGPPQPHHLYHQPFKNEQIFLVHGLHKIGRGPNQP